MTIALILFVHNDLPFLRATLPYEKKWVDQVCILDLGSTDGTKEFCEAYLSGMDVYRRREVNTAPELGFAEAANAACALATTDWLYYSAADQMLLLSDHARVKPLLESTDAEVLSLSTLNIFPKDGDTPGRLESGILRAGDSDVYWERHRRIFRRDAGVVYRGYIHEEPFIGDRNCYPIAPHTDLSVYHFNSWVHSELRRWRYSWMLRRAYNDKSLQTGTNNWWYEKYVPENWATIEAEAAKYEEYVATTGLK